MEALVAVASGVIGKLVTVQEILYERPEEQFVFLRRGRAELMLEPLEEDGWVTGAMTAGDAEAKLAEVAAAARRTCALL